MPRPKPPPITITPAATPSRCLLDDYERARAGGEHVRFLEAGEPTGQCWCGESHRADPGHVRDIHVRTTRRG